MYVHVHTYTTPYIHSSSGTHSHNQGRRQGILIGGGGRIYILVRIRAPRSAHARERVSARIYGWGPGARLRAPGGVQGQSPGGGPGGEAPEALGF